MRNTVHFGRPLLRTICAALATLTLGLGLMLGPAATAHAQDDPIPASAPVEPNYTVGIDDILIIASPGHEDVNQQVLVLPDGTIRVNGVPEKIKAAGMTLEEVRAEVFKGLDRLYNNLEISVTLKEVNSRSVTILGSRSPGRVRLLKDMRVSGLIAAGGGLLQPRTKLARGTLQRNLQVIKLDMAKIVGMEPDVEADLLLQPNDTVVLDYIEEPPPPMFSVLGAVVKGGTFNMPLDGSPISLARAVADAGGRTEKASLGKVKLLRKSTTLDLNLIPLLVDGKADAAEGQLLMQDGDVLIIPELDAKYMVLGQVNRPNTVYIPETRTVTVQQALAEGGGPNQNADLRAAGIMRIVEGKKQFLKINLEDSLKKPEKSPDIIMQDGDVLYIPPKKRGLSISDITNPLWVLSMFGLRFF